MRCRAAYRSAVTVAMHVTPPVIAAAKKDYLRRLRHYYPAAVTTVHIPHASRREGRHQGNGQPNLDRLFKKDRRVRAYGWLRHLFVRDCAPKPRGGNKATEYQLPLLFNFHCDRIVLQTFTLPWGIYPIYRLEQLPDV